MVILGFTAAGLLGLHVGAVRGIAESGSMSVAMDVAAQRVEQYALEGDQALTARGCAAAVGCSREPPNPDDPALPGRCSGRVGAADVLDSVGNPAGAVVGTRYRYDTTVVALAGGQQGGLMTTVSVCWREASGAVRRVESRRLIAPRNRS